MKLRLKVWIVGFLVISSLNIILGQSVSKKFYVSIFGSTEPVDDRIIGEIQSRYEQFKLLNEITPPDKTIFLGIDLGYNLLRKWNFTFDVGLLYAYERNNYIRTFNHCVLVKKGEPCFDVLKNLDVYSYNLLGLNFDLNYNVRIVSDVGFKVGAVISPLTKFKSFYQEALITHNKNHLWKIDFFSLEINPRVGLFYKNIELDVFYRVWQYKKVERAIHPKWSDGYGQIEEDYETYNPQKIGVSLKYRFNLSKKINDE